MLVLLIIFMVVAPLSTVGVLVDLPVARVNPAKRPDKSVYLTAKPDFTLAIGSETVPAGDRSSAT